jgi:hypothetical protein
MPKQPSGDVSSNVLSGIGFAVSKAGVGEMDSKIGAKEIETKTDDKINKA